MEGEVNDEDDLDFEQFESLSLDQDPRNETFSFDTCENFHCCNSSVSGELALSRYHILVDQALQHAISGTDAYPSIFMVSGKYSNEIFRGVMLNTGASKISTAGYGQAQAYMRDFNAEMDTSTAGKVTAQFGVGDARSVGKLDVITPIGQVTFYVMDAEIPFLPGYG